MLLEVGRKLLQGLMMDRLLPIWERHQLLSHQAHGAIRGKGTHTATMEFLNVLEEVEMAGASVYTSSWDWRHAFDSLSSVIKMLAWHRGGLPPGAIELLEQLDRGNRTVPRTPFAAAYAKHQDWAAHHVDAEPGPQRVDSFEAERGDCQGAPPSAIHWIIFFDILNRAMEIEARQEIYLRTSVWTLQKAQDVAFVDDLQSVAPTMSALQGKADIVSAFAIVMGMELSIKKLRFLVAHYGENDSGREERERREEEGLGTEETLVVHLRGWTPHYVHQKGEDLTYVGIKHDILPGLGSPLSNHAKMMTQLRGMIRILNAKHALADAKIKTVEVCLMAAAVYKGAYDSTTLWKQKEADTVITAAERSWLNHPTLATDLMHIPKKGGGLWTMEYE